jgi:hypothetical protein
MAQRYASRKRKKRVAPARPPAAVAHARTPAPVTPEAEAEDDDGAVVTPIRPAARGPVRITRAGVAGQSLAPRSFASYAAEYQYVARDLRRIAIVGGGLLVALVVLSFFIG